MRKLDAVVIGSGPNGLAAALTLARASLSVLVVEAGETIGGACRTAASGEYLHDVCASVHAMGRVSPAFRALGIAGEVAWAEPELVLAHPFDDGRAAVLERSVEATAERFGRDARRYLRLMRPLTEHAAPLLVDALRGLHVPEHPLLMARLGIRGILSVHALRRLFRGDEAPALLAGSAAHATAPFGQPLSAALGIMLGVAAHAGGWPFARGGSQRIVDALAVKLREYGGEIRTGWRVTSLRALPPARAYLFDTTPRQLLAIAGEHLPWLYRKRIARFRYGAGVYKIDYELDGPVPWRNADCGRAGTVHLGGSFGEMAESEDLVRRGRIAERPFVLAAQPSVIDSTRAPAGRHVFWAYCHVPHGSDADMRPRIEAQIERFAPGFRELVSAAHVRTPADLERENPNLIGGHIAGGTTDATQLFTRPIVRLDPYSTPDARIFLCSSSTPPGGGVHGMCGYWAARSALRRVFGKRVEETTPLPQSPLDC